MAKIFTNKQLKELSDLLMCEIKEQIEENIYEYYHKDNLNLLTILSREIADHFNSLKNLIVSNNNSVRNLSFRFEKIETSDMLPSEDYAMSYYRKLGWDIVVKTNKAWRYHNIDIPNEIREIFYPGRKVGRPDLIAISKTNPLKYLFIEVKTGFDGLREGQLKWIKNHPKIPVEVFHLTQNIKSDASVIKLKN